MDIHGEWQSTDGPGSVRVTSVYGDTLTWGGGVMQWLSMDGPRTARVTPVYGDTLTYGSI